MRFIQECKTERARKAVIDAMNAGTVRVLFGSTSMLGTGVNAQKRCVAIHHLDTPWRPSDLQQRDGRGVRAGNEIAKHFCREQRGCHHLRGGEVTGQLQVQPPALQADFHMRSSKAVRWVRVPSTRGQWTKKSGMNFSEYMALLSGNTDLLDKAKLEKRIASLEGERKSFNKGKRDSEFKLGVKDRRAAQQHGFHRCHDGGLEPFSVPWCRLIRRAAALI